MSDANKENVEKHKCSESGSSVVIKPCPFCGEIPKLEEHNKGGLYFEIACENIGCAIEPHIDHECEQVVLVLWNTRAL